MSQDESPFIEEENQLYRLEALVRRAAELLRDSWQGCLAPGNEPENAGYYGRARTAALQMRNEWEKQRDQWLADAGLEK